LVLGLKWAHLCALNILLIEIFGIPFLQFSLEDSGKLKQLLLALL
jgi:hypothetical protein